MSEIENKYTYADLSRLIPEISNYICDAELTKLSRREYQRGEISRKSFIKFGLCIDKLFLAMFNDIKRFDPKKEI